MPAISSLGGSVASFDYIIVGAGSAGCVLANRLSANPNHRVLLLEGGGTNKSFLIAMPKGIGKVVMDKRYSLSYDVKQPRKPDLPSSEVWVRGRGLGGSSAINGMIYVRGQAEDFMEWEKHAGPEWGWPAMKQAYRAIENHELGDDGLRGGAGPLHISAGTHRYPLAEALISAGEQLGLERREDLNREDIEGVGYYSHNIKDGRRQSASVAFLDPVRQRKNLTVVTEAQVLKVNFKNNRACGVTCDVAGKHQEFATHGEVVLCAGAIHSPLILQHSGIGPAELLKRLGIPQVYDSPDVGERFRDHLGIFLSYELKNDPGINHAFYGLGLLRSMIQYALCKSGPMATGPFEVGAFVRTDPALQRPDIQLYLAGITFKASENENFPAPLQEVERRPGMSAYCQLLHPTSEGSIRATSSNPYSAPEITPNWLTTEHDQQAAIRLIRYVRRYFSQKALAAYVGVEHVPGAAVETDEQILDFFRRLSTCGTHAIGSCRMGNDQRSVVDSRLRVRGVAGLRVADCSVMPDLTTGNTNAPAMAVGWRAADLILTDAQPNNKREAS